MQNVHKYANAKFFAFFAKSANTYLLETPLWKGILRGLR